MSKTALICGSYAFYSIMGFYDQFKNHILADKVHMLNVSFLVPTMRKEFGGCGGNIAYNLHLLGANSVPMATVGEDFAPYLSWMEKHHMNTTHMKVIEGAYTGQAFITTDMDDNQITAFHPGAMSDSPENIGMPCPGSNTKGIPALENCWACSIMPSRPSGETMPISALLTSLTLF